MKLQEQLKSFHEAGAEIWVVSNDPAEKLEEMRKKLGLEFPTLMDPDLSVAGSYGIKTEKGDLPHPTAIVVSPEGDVTYVRVDENYANRPETQELLDAVQRVKKAASS